MCLILASPTEICLLIRTWVLRKDATRPGKPYVRQQAEWFGREQSIVA